MKRCFKRNIDVTGFRALLTIQWTKNFKFHEISLHPQRSGSLSVFWTNGQNCFVPSYQLPTLGNEKDLDKLVADGVGWNMHKFWIVAKVAYPWNNDYSFYNQYVWLIEWYMWIRHYSDRVHYVHPTISITRLTDEWSG